MFATNGTAQRLPVNCPACKSECPRAGLLRHGGQTSTACLCGCLNRHSRLPTPCPKPPLLASHRRPAGGLMLAADMVKPVRKLTPAPPVPPPKQPRSQQAAAAAAPKKGPATPSPSGSTLARQQAAAARASLAGVRSSSGLARAGSASSGGAGSGLASGGARPDPIPSRPAWLRVSADTPCYIAAAQVGRMPWPQTS